MNKIPNAVKTYYVLPGVSVPLQQYLEKQDAHTPFLLAPILPLARSTIAHARHAAHSGSDKSDAPTAAPCVAIAKVWSSIAWTSEGWYVS
jgi:hypothetical protein